MKKHERREIGVWKSEQKNSFPISLYVGGDYSEAKKACRKICFPSGLCVTIEKTAYIFGGGSEEGVRVGLIQYPPFPETEKILVEKATELGQEIAKRNFQFSFTIVTPIKTIFHSRVK